MIHMLCITLLKHFPFCKAKKQAESENFLAGLQIVIQQSDWQKFAFTRKSSKKTLRVQNHATKSNSSLELTRLKKKVLT